jgi:hypothetical protein
MGPDGLEERSAYYDEAFADNEDEVTEADYDDDMLDIAQARMQSFFMDKIIGGQ